MSRPARLKTPVQTLDTVQDHLYSLHKDYGSWRAVSIRFGCKIPAGTLCAVAGGREPKHPEHRKLLGLPAYGWAAVCPTCGEIHLRRTCPKTTKPRARRAISLTDPESAAATIINHMSAANVRRLVELLDIGE